MKYYAGFILMGLAVAGGFTALMTGDWRWLLLTAAAYLLGRNPHA